MDIPSGIRAFAEGVEHEDVLSLAEAAKFLPVRKDGKPLHVNIIDRLARDGVRGVVLETLMVGGARYASRQAVGRFLRRLDSAKSHRLGLGSQPRRASAVVLHRSGIADVPEVAGGES